MRPDPAVKTRTIARLVTHPDISVSEIEKPAEEIKAMIASIFRALGIDTAVLEFDAELEGKAFEQQASYQLWHLLYAYEGDDSPSGNEKLYTLLEEKFGFKKEHGRILANVTLPADYGNLSAKAMRKIYPFIKELHYDKACLQAGYKHSASSLTIEKVIHNNITQSAMLMKPIKQSRIQRDWQNT